MMDGDVRLIQLFPNKRENVLFSAYDSQIRFRENKILKEKYSKKMCEVISKAVEAGGKNFLCSARNSIECLFFEQVSICKSRYPGIKAIICRGGLRNDDKFGEDFADDMILLFPEHKGWMNQFCIEAMAAVSAYAIVSIPDGAIPRSKVLKLCDDLEIPVINLFQSESNRTDVKLCRYSQEKDLPTNSYEIAQNIPRLIEQDKIYQEWLFARETIYVRMTQETKPIQIAHWIDRLKESDQAYNEYLSRAYLAYGTQQIYQFVKSLKASFSSTLLEGCYRSSSESGPE